MTPMDVKTGLDPDAQALLDAARAAPRKTFAEMTLAEARTDVRERRARDERDAAAVGHRRLDHRGEEPRHARIGLGAPAARERFVREAREHRHDREVTAPSEEIAKEHRLELDRVLGPV